MPDFSSRSTAPEIMDDLQCDGVTVFQTLREIKNVNKLLGGHGVTLNALSTLLNSKISASSNCISICDLGCGGGDTLLEISRWAKAKKLKVKLTGIDANPNIISYAKEQCKENPDIEFRVMNVLDTEFEDFQQDIYICTLFLHHFSDGQLKKLLYNINKLATVGIIVNDLERNPIAYYSIKLLARLISKSAMFRYDAPLSVLRGFKKRDLMKFFKVFEGEGIILKWKWAFRWQMIVLKD